MSYRFLDMMKYLKWNMKIVYVCRLDESWLCSQLENREKLLWFQWTLEKEEKMILIIILRCNNLQCFHVPFPWMNSLNFNTHNRPQLSIHSPLTHHDMINLSLTLFICLFQNDEVLLTLNICVFDLIDEKWIVFDYHLSQFHFTFSHGFIHLNF